MRDVLCTLCCERGVSSHNLLQTRRNISMTLSKRDLSKRPLSTRGASCLTTCALLFSIEGEGSKRERETERASECVRERARERDESSQDHENIVMPLRMIVELKEAAANGIHVCVKMNRSIFEFFFKITGGAERGYSKRSDAVCMRMCVCLFESHDVNA